MSWNKSATLPLAALAALGILCPHPAAAQFIRLTKPHAISADANAGAGAKITFSAPTAITTAGATLGTPPGKVVAAVDFGAGKQVVKIGSGTSAKTITFDGDDANATVIGGNGTFTGAFTKSTGNFAFDAVLNSANYDTANGTTKQIVLKGLTPGKRYSVQLFALDDRDDTGENSRLVSFSDLSGNKSTDIKSGANAYILGTFTATASQETIVENLPNNGNINALVLRDLSAAG